MSTDPQAAPRPLPDRPNLRHLKDQAKDLLRTGAAASISDAQFKIARLYGFGELAQAQVSRRLFEEIGQLKQAIDTNDLDRVKIMMTRNPALHGAPLGYGKDGPLTWVAECRVPWESRVQHGWRWRHGCSHTGSDVHQGGDGPLMRAALNGYRIPMMDLLVSHGADVNARWHGHFRSSLPPANRWTPTLSNGCSIAAPIRTVATMAIRSAAIISWYRSRLPHWVVRAFRATIERLHRHPARRRCHHQVRRSARVATAPRTPGRSDVAD